MSEIIEHTGRVVSISNTHVQVLIEQLSACSSCHAKSACGSADAKEKIIDVINIKHLPLKVGDEVFVCGQTSMGLKAVLLAFVLPFLIILIALAVFGFFFENELLAAVLSLSLLLPYYGLLFLFKDALTAKFQFQLREK